VPRSLFVLDTGALMAYAHGSDVIGELLFHASDHALAVAVPSVCLAEAYSLLDYDEMPHLRLLRAHDRVNVVPLLVGLDSPDEMPFVGGMARRAGRLGAGHACWVAQTNHANMYTSQAHEIQAVLGKDWPIVEV